jgi:hypothetical protein
MLGCNVAHKREQCMTKAKFDQEQHQWLLRAEEAEKAERNFMTVASREGRLRKPALPSGR